MRSPVNMRSCRCPPPHPLHHCRHSPPRLSGRPSPRPRHHKHRVLQHPRPQTQPTARTMGPTSPNSSSRAEAPRVHCDGCCSSKTRGCVHGCCRLAPRGCTHGHAVPHRPQLRAIWRGVGLQGRASSRMRTHTLESVGRRGSWRMPVASTCLAAQAPSSPRRLSSLCARTHAHTAAHAHACMLSANLSKKRSSSLCTHCVLTLRPTLRPVVRPAVRACTLSCDQATITHHCRPSPSPSPRVATEPEHNPDVSR